MDSTEWIAVDWTDEMVRYWVMDEDGSPQDQGSAPVDPAAPFEAALAPIIAHLLADDAPSSIWITGVPTLPGGSAELPFPAVPHAPPRPDDSVKAATVDSRLDIRLIPGLEQARPRGVLTREAVLLRGFLALDDTFDGVVALLGAENHWVHISAGEVVSFASMATGDILRAAGVSKLASVDADAMADTLARPETLALQLGAARAEVRLGGAKARSDEKLWGACLGAELAATRPFWLGQRVCLIGSAAVQAAYREALEHQGVMVETAAEEPVLLAGFCAVRGAS